MLSGEVCRFLRKAALPAATKHLGDSRRFLLQASNADHMRTVLDLTISQSDASCAVASRSISRRSVEETRSPAATMPVVLVMLEAIRDHFGDTGVRIGMKPAGGIRASKSALHHLVMVQETLGSEWLRPSLYRFGASSLLDDLGRQLLRLENRRYSATGDVPRS